MIRPHIYQLSMRVCALISVTVSMAAIPQAALPASQPRVALEAATSSQPQRDGIAIQAGPATLRIIALRDDILRVRIAPGSTLAEDASWAVLPTSRSKSVDVQPTLDVTSVGFRTASLDVRVERSPLRIVVRDLSGNIICADALGRPTEFRLGGFSVQKEMPADEHFFGLGDKTGSFDRRNQAYVLWNTDHGIEESLDPIYKSSEPEKSEYLHRFRGGRHQIDIRLSLSESDFELVPPTRYPLQAATDLLSRKFRNTGTTQWNKEQ